LYEASLKASLAISGVTHVISNNILPGFTGALYISTDHLPQPIGTSNGLEVKGLSGNILIQIFPHLLTNLTIALLADSICLEVIKPLVVAFIQ
jgi:hypothetical protein